MANGSGTAPERLAKLRELMKKNKVDAYLIPSTDPHKSEYVPAVWQRRKWLSGFTGSGYQFRPELSSVWICAGPYSGRPPPTVTSAARMIISPGRSSILWTSSKPNAPDNCYRR